MPTNVTVEYAMAEGEYSKAATLKEKVSALQKMLSTCPTHKGCEKLRQEIKTKLAKYRERQEKEAKQKTKGKAFAIKKEGAATISLVGLPNTGKSLILNKLTRAKAKIADYNFTTKMPVIGIMSYMDLKLQVIEIPAIFEGYSKSGKGPQFLSVVRQSDLVLIVTDKAELGTMFNEFEKASIKFNEKIIGEDDEFANIMAFIVINKKDVIDVDKVHQGLCKYYNFDLYRMSALDDKDIEKLKDQIWKHLGLIKIRTKEPGKKVSKGEPLCLKKGSVVQDMAKHLHKDFIKRFRFARVWGKSAKFNGQQVGLNHKLADEDVVEIHLK